MHIQTLFTLQFLASRQSSKFFASTAHKHKPSLPISVFLLIPVNRRFSASGHVIPLSCLEHPSIYIISYRTGLFDIELLV